MNKNIIYEIDLTKPYEDDLEKGLEREECSICLDNDLFTYKNWAKLKACSHMFHRHCIDLWIERNSSEPLGTLCPLCTRPIYDIPSIPNIPNIPDIPNIPEIENNRCRKVVSFIYLLFSCTVIFVIPSLIMSK